MKSLSKPAAYLGDRKPSLPVAHSHQDKGRDYVYSPDHYVLGAFAKKPEIRVKKPRHVPKESIADVGESGPKAQNSTTPVTYRYNAGTQSGAP